LDSLKKTNDPETSKNMEKFKEQVKKLKLESAEKDKQIIFYKEEVEKLRRQLDIYQQANDDDLKVRYGCHSYLIRKGENFNFRTRGRRERSGDA
jgi:uncharacterized membrane-anchored protein